VVGTPPVNQRLKRVGSAHAPSRRLPTRRRHLSVQQLTDRPDMIRDPGRHCWRLLTTVG